jgi:metallophosphoesterase superfamily enzyme
MFDPLVISVPRTPPSRILLLSDTHLGATGAIESAKEQFIMELVGLVAKESIPAIFHLVDLVDGTIPNGAVHISDVLAPMNAYKIPITVIGGNHDREFVAACPPPRNPSSESFGKWQSSSISNLLLEAPTDKGSSTHTTSATITASATN